MHIDKRFVLLILAILAAVMPSFGQRFTKKEQALREARAINYFYGNSFTLSTGYVHGWLISDHFDENAFGRSGAYQNTRESFAFTFAWDYCKSKHQGFQVSAQYAQFGGELNYFHDNGLGYGPQKRDDLTQQIHLNEALLRGKYRYFIPLTYESRISLDAGAYLGYIVGSYDNSKNWDYGAVVGIGYDWKHLSVGVDYMPCSIGRVIDHSTTRVSGLLFNVGVHLWK